MTVFVHKVSVFTARLM